jgi:hypothetical protein
LTFSFPCIEFRAPFMTKRDTPTTNPSEIEALRERLRSGQLRPEDKQLIDRLLGLLLSLIQLVEKKNASIKRLKRWLFGPLSEKRKSSSKDSQKDESEKETENESSASSESNERSKAESTETPVSEAEKKRVGHGRLSASQYSGARLVRCLNSEYRAGDGCPSRGCRGRLYDTNAPSVFIQLEGQPLVGATRYEQEVLRCSACQTRYTAQLPEEVRPQKYLESADAAIVLAKHSAGLPFYRMKRLQSIFGVPLSESVQFERCQSVADTLFPVYLRMKTEAAQGQVIYADDTRVKILSLIKENKGLSQDERRGMQTTAIVTEVGDRRIALFESGRRHAGENLEKLFEERLEGLPPPIQMSDALSANWSSKSDVIAAKCMAHARRQFVEIEEQFPTECSRVLEAIGMVYSIEAETLEMSASQRLEFHKLKSGPIMSELKVWIEERFEQRLVEPNSSLGKAFGYMLNHWEGLTRFLSVEACPLDNNLCERALKQAVLNRKNALFYKTEHGAAIGDILLSIIETCRMNGVAAFDYIVEVLRNEQKMRRDVGEWLPWAYKRRLDQMKPGHAEMVQSLAA